jgi:outer membrane lipase/esterase
MTVKLSDGTRRALGCLALAAGLLVASCGGGQQVSSFHPSRLVSFGDETSLIVDINNDGNGSKYGVNATVSADDQTRVCTGNPLWNQSVAAAYGFVFPQCNPPPAVDSPTSRIRATFGARAADLGSQIDAQQAESPLGAGDLVTVLIGENDVIAQYQQYPVLSEVEITANVEAAGEETGRQVNRLADLGAKVLLATTPDAGVTPFALAENLAHADTDRAAMLTRLSAAFNASLRGTITNDGKRIGLILFDEFLSAVAKFPGLDGFTNTTDGVCDLTRSALIPPSSLDCTAQTFVTDGTAAYLWADDRHIGPTAQNIFGSLAITRAQNNPF